jgi:transcriptional regulator with XRE-family HTH domain
MSIGMASELQVAFGEHVRDRRAALKLTQIDLSRKLGIRQSTLSDIENGRHAPTLETVEKLAKALKTTAQALLS